MLTKRRDMTEKQFLAALDKHGFGRPKTFGYVRLPEPYASTSVSLLNGGDTLRSKLAYLLAELKRKEERTER